MVHQFFFSSHRASHFTRRQQETQHYHISYRIHIFFLQTKPISVMIGFVNVFVFACIVCGIDGFLSAPSIIRKSSISMANTIAVFGGTGATGKEVVFQALKSGANVVVLARDPAKMLVPAGSGGDKADTPLTDARLKVLKGDVTNQKDVDAVFASGDITGVVIALGGKTKDVGPTMLTDGTTCVINSMKKNCASKRISILTSIGAGDSEQQAPLMFKALMWTVMKGIFTDKNNQEKLFLLPEGPGHDLE
jgi:NAD(P)H-binding